MTTRATAVDRQGAIFHPGEFLQSGRYALYKMLGRGGMGEVWAARDLHREEGHPESWVAIKALRPSRDLDEDVGRRVRAEFDTLFNVKHNHLVRVYHSGTDDKRGIFYYVMEYLLGTTLQQAITKTGGLPLANALRFVAKIAAASHALHRAGVIHRDLKPDNILLTRHGRPVLIDLSIAKRDPKYFPGRNTLQTDVDTRLGTMDYMSPEQCMGEALDPRSDVYALGLISYVAKAGYHPAQGQPGGAFPTDFRWWAGWHLHHAPKPLYEVKSWIHPDVATAVSKACAKRPSDRYTSAAELATAWEDLAEWLLDHDLSNPPKVARRAAGLCLPFATTQDATTPPATEPTTLPHSARVPAVSTPRPALVPSSFRPTICGLNAVTPDARFAETGQEKAAVTGEPSAPQVPMDSCASPLPISAPVSTPNGTEIIRLGPASSPHTTMQYAAGAVPSRTQGGTEILRMRARGEAATSSGTSTPVPTPSSTLPVQPSPGAAVTPVAQMMSTAADAEAGRPFPRRWVGALVAGLLLGVLATLTVDRLVRRGAGQGESAGTAAGALGSGVAPPASSNTAPAAGPPISTSGPVAATSNSVAVIPAPVTASTSAPVLGTAAPVTTGQLLKSAPSAAPRPLPPNTLSAAKSPSPPSSRATAPKSDRIKD